MVVNGHTVRHIQYRRCSAGAGASSCATLTGSLVLHLANVDDKVTVCQWRFRIGGSALVASVGLEGMRWRSETTIYY